MVLSLTGLLQCAADRDHELSALKIRLLYFERIYLNQKRLSPHKSLRPRSYSTYLFETLHSILSVKHYATLAISDTTLSIIKHYTKSILNYYIHPYT